MASEQELDSDDSCQEYDSDASDEANFLYPEGGWQEGSTIKIATYLLAFAMYKEERRKKIWPQWLLSLQSMI